MALAVIRDAKAAKTLTLCDLLCMLDRALIMATVGCLPFVFPFSTTSNTLDCGESGHRLIRGTTTAAKCAHKCTGVYKLNGKNTFVGI